MILKAAIYVRSSKDLHNVSCEAQEEQLKERVERDGIALYRVFCDKALSSTRDVRPEFDEMLTMAMSKPSPFQKIYCLDTSRFGRDQAETTVLLHQLRKKHGIDVVFHQMPQTGTYMDQAFEAIMSAFDYIHSQQSKAKGVASMKQNIRNGWRAGGRAPYGYTLETVELEEKRNGEAITKSKLAPDPKTAIIAREYFERRAMLEPRRAILEDFFRRGIPSPTGNDRWSVATAKSMEDNIDVYLGHLVFNRHNERIKDRGKPDGYAAGKKWRPKEEWVVYKDAHEPLITPEIAFQIKAIKKKGLREAPFNRRVYVLSGLIKCDVCGTQFVGDSGLYRCNSKSKIGHRCENHAISQEVIEEALSGMLCKHLFKFRNLKTAINRVQQRIDKGGAGIRQLEKRLAGIEKERERVKELYRKGLIEMDEVADDLEGLNRDRKSVSEELEERKAADGVVEITDDQIKAFISNILDEVQHTDPKIRKRAMQTLFREIQISPKEGSPWARNLAVKGVYLPLTGVKLASPRGFEPLSQA